MAAGPLGEFEQIVLLATLRLGEQAYGVSIRAEIASCTDREPTPGALYTTLDRLEDKGLVKSRLGDPRLSVADELNATLPSNVAGWRPLPAHSGPTSDC
jgi:hypothetical protein